MKFKKGETVKIIGNCYGWKKGQTFTINSVESRGGTIIYFSGTNVYGAWENTVRKLTKLERALK